ncbi:M15 family metallopeptidase [Psychromonas ossibalaenae]|uniref:M15 family metallopeptidase n=1 Tax=Psychromonas ossibalaenae TaxID=444922 RepID=UPI00036799CA|nr:M15 family metallopeptidase [Psychromonas ossibalaenae]
MNKTLRRLMYISVLLYPLSALADISRISETQCLKMSETGVMDKHAPVQCGRLRNVSFTHVDFQGIEKTGQIVVLDAVAPYVENIFTQLLHKKFPIHQAVTIEHFSGDDDKSMQANNSSGFNYRAITGQQSLSLHAYGAAVDINPLQNPFVSFTSWGTATFKPLKGHQYLNRMHSRLNKENSRGFAEQVLAVFAQNGFIYWGGYWDTPIDFQHFQTSRDMAYLMSDLDGASAGLFFKNYVNWYRQCSTGLTTQAQLFAVNDYASYLKKRLKTKSLHTSLKTDKQQLLNLITQQLNSSPENCSG